MASEKSRQYCQFRSSYGLSGDSLAISATAVTETVTTPYVRLTTESNGFYSMLINAAG